MKTNPVWKPQVPTKEQSKGPILIKKAWDWTPPGHFYPPPLSNKSQHKLIGTGSSCKHVVPHLCVWSRVRSRPSLPPSFFLGAMIVGWGRWWMEREHGETSPPPPPYQCNLLPAVEFPSAPPPETRHWLVDPQGGGACCSRIIIKRNMYYVYLWKNR